MVPKWGDVESLGSAKHDLEQLIHSQSYVILRRALISCLEFNDVLRPVFHVAPFHIRGISGVHGVTD